MLSNHLNIAKDGKVYCHRIGSVVDLSFAHFKEYCKHCLFLQGLCQGDGIECKYEDPLSSEPITLVTDPYYYQQRMTHILTKGARRGGVYNLSDTEMMLLGVTPDVEMDADEGMVQSENEAAKLKQMLLEQDQRLKIKLEQIKFDPSSDTKEIDVEQHLNADTLVRRWVEEHPEFHGIIIARVAGIDEHGPTLNERGYYVRFGVIDRFDDFGMVSGPQRDKVLRRIGFYGKQPGTNKIDMIVTSGAAVRSLRDGRIGTVYKYTAEGNKLRVLVSFAGYPPIPLYPDEIEPLMVKSPDRDTQGRFAFMAVNDPQPPKASGEIKVTELSATEALARVLQSVNHQKHLGMRKPEDREQWIKRFKGLWVGNQPYYLTEVSLEDLVSRTVDFDEDTVQKYVDNFPTEKYPIIAPDTVDDKSNFVILDGNHMVEAARRLGKKSLEAYVRKDGLKTLRKAIWNEADHPRGEPENAGEFAPKEGKKKSTDNVSGSHSAGSFHAQLDVIRQRIADPKTTEAKKYELQVALEAKHSDKATANSDDFAQLYPKADPEAPLQVEDINALIEGAKAHSDVKDWYNEFHGVLTELLDGDSEMFKSLLAATSPNATVMANVSLATKAYWQIKKGLPIEGYLPAVKRNVESISRGEALSGKKITAFEANQKGDPDAVTVDMHMTRLFFGCSTPSEKQRTFIANKCKEVAVKLGWTAAQVQAALWAFQLARTGKKAHTFSEGLERKRDEFRQIKDALAGKGEYQPTTRKRTKSEPSESD